MRESSVVQKNVVVNDIQIFGSSACWSKWQHIISLQNVSELYVTIGEGEIFHVEELIIIKTCVYIDFLRFSNKVLNTSTMEWRDYQAAIGK